MQVREKNAEDLVEQQVDTAEVTLYIKVSDDNDDDSNNEWSNESLHQAFNADNPVFPSPWTPSDPTIRINITENIPPGQVRHGDDDNNNDINDDNDNIDNIDTSPQPIFKLAAKDPLTGQPIMNYQKLEQGRALETLIQVIVIMIMKMI